MISRRFKLQHISQLKHRVVINQRNWVPDNSGGGGWKIINSTTMWAAIRKPSTNDVERWAKMNIQVTHMVIVRYGQKINDSCTININDQEFFVRAVFDPDMTKTFISCLCEYYPSLKSTT